MAFKPNDRLSMITSLRDPSFGIPTDVTFQVMGLSSPVFSVTPVEEVLLGEVVGHKLILGMASPVFKGEFFGPAKETKDVIPVRETTVEAFERMLDYIYNKNIDWSGVSLLELYDVVNLAEKYHIPGLLEEIKMQIQGFPLTMDSLMDAFDTAIQFIQFPNISTILKQACAKFLKASLKSDSERLQFAISLSGSGQEGSVLHLLELTRDLPESKCSNCKTEDCQDGKELSRPEMFFPGCKVVVSKQHQILLKDHMDKVFYVQKVEGNSLVRMKCELRFRIIYEKKPTMCFKCT